RHTRCYRDWSSDVCSSDLQIRGQTQCLRKARGAGATNILLRDDLDRGGRLRQFLRSLRDRRHLKVHQLFERQFLECPGRLGGVEIGRASWRERVVDWDGGG